MSKLQKLCERRISQLKDFNKIDENLRQLCRKRSVRNHAYIRALINWSRHRVDDLLYSTVPNACSASKSQPPAPTYFKIELNCFCFCFCSPMCLFLAALVLQTFTKETDVHVVGVSHMFT